MLTLRLFRVGKKNQPSFKIVIIDKRRSARKGRFVEEVGFYNPQTKEKVLKQERIKYWLSVGAEPSATLQNLLISEKIVEGTKTPIYMKKVKKETEAKPAEVKKEAVAEKKGEEAKEEKPKEELPKQEKAPEETKPSEEKPVLAEAPAPAAEEAKPIEEKPAEETSKIE